MWARFNTLESKRRTEQARFEDGNSRIGHRPDGSEFWDLRGKDVGIQRNRVFLRDKQRCQECGRALEWSECEMDHIRSRGRGGDDHLDNLQTLCPPCHRRKHVSVRWTTQEQVGASHE